MSIRSRSGRFLAVVATAGLTVGLSLTGMPTATAADPAITNLTLTGGALTAPVGKATFEEGLYYDLKGSTSFHMALSFDMPADTSHRVYYTNWGASGSSDPFYEEAFTALEKNHDSTLYWGTTPRINNLGLFSHDGTPTDLPIYIPAGVTPGKYRLTMPIVLLYSDFTHIGVVVGTQDAVGYFTVLASPTNSRNTTSLDLSGKRGSKTQFKVKAQVPSYQTGAKVTAYFKAKGAKKYTSVGTSTVKWSQWGYVNFKLGKGKIRKAGTFYLKFGAVPYSAGYDGRTKTIK